MELACLEVKPSKCAVLYARRSGNNFYKGNGDKLPKLTVQYHKLITFWLRSLTDC